MRFHKTAKIMSRNLSISCNSFLLSSQHNGKTRVSAHARLPFEKGHTLPAPRGKSFLTLLPGPLPDKRTQLKLLQSHRRIAVASKLIVNITNIIIVNIMNVSYDTNRRSSTASNY